VPVRSSGRTHPGASSVSRGDASRQPFPPPSDARYTQFMSLTESQILVAFALWERHVLVPMRKGLSREEGRYIERPVLGHLVRSGRDRKIGRQEDVTQSRANGPLTVESKQEGAPR